LATAERSDSGARHKALYQNLVYGKRLAYDIGWARLDAFCLAPLSLRSAWRRRVAPNLNQKVENATLRNYSEATVRTTVRTDAYTWAETVIVLRRTLSSFCWRVPIYSDLQGLQLSFQSTNLSALELFKLAFFVSLVSCVVTKPNGATRRER